MKKYFFTFFFFAFYIHVAFSQIEVKMPVSISNVAYDSLKTFSEISDIKILKGQEVYFMPMSPIYQKIGYRNAHTKVLEMGEMELDAAALSILPKNKRFVYQPNPSEPYYSDVTKLEMTKWKIEEVITKKEDLAEMEDYSYLKLVNEAGESFYYFINPYNQYADNYLLLTGYFERLAQENNQKTFITRRNVVLKDFYTNESFFSPKEEVWNTKKLILSRLEADDNAKPYLLLTNKQQHHIIIPVEVADENYQFLAHNWRFLFLNADLKKKYRFSDENWQKIIKGTPQIGMTKQEILVAIGLPTTTFASVEEIMKENTWEYLVGNILSLRIEFTNESVRKIWNYEESFVTPYPVKKEPRH